MVLVIPILIIVGIFLYAVWDINTILKSPQYKGNKYCLTFGFLSVATKKVETAKDTTHYCGVIPLRCICVYVTRNETEAQRPSLSRKCPTLLIPIPKVSGKPEVDVKRHVVRLSINDIINMDKQKGTVYIG